MKKIIFILAIMAYTFAGQSQDFVREQDKKTGKVLLRGKIIFKDIMDETTCKWLQKGADEYKPNPEVIKKLKAYADNYRFVLFIGTWCEDTQDLLPKFYRVIKDAGIDMNAIEMYGVDRMKEALNIEHKLYNIQKIPTFIVMLQYREVGRIVESVNSSIEEDLLAMIEKDAIIVERKKAEKY